MLALYVPCYCYNGSEINKTACHAVEKMIFQAATFYKHENRLQPQQKLKFELFAYKRD